MLHNLDMRCIINLYKVGIYKTGVDLISYQ